MATPIPICRSSDDYKLGRHVCRLRRARGWTQKDLASRAGISKTSVEALEAGRAPALRTLRAIARALGLRVGALFELLDSPSTDPALDDLVELAASCSSAQRRQLLRVGRALFDDRPASETRRALSAVPRAKRAL